MFPLRSTLAFCLPLWGVLWWVTPSMPAETDLIAELLALANRARAEHHLIELAHSGELSEVARSHGEELVRRGELDHQGANGHNPLERAHGAGIRGFTLLAENLGRSDVRGDRLGAVVKGWLASPVHRENLLSPAFNTAGGAVLESPSGETFAVQLYASFPPPQP
jgi:uncharacterized protein YkwD